MRFLSTSIRTWAIVGGGGSSLPSGSFPRPWLRPSWHEFLETSRRTRLMSNRVERKSLSNGYDVLEESQSIGSNHLDNMVIKAYKPYIHKLSYKPYIVLVRVTH